MRDKSRMHKNNHLNYINTVDREGDGSVGINAVAEKRGKSH